MESKKIKTAIFSYYVAALILVAAFEGFVIFKQNHVINNLKKSLPHLLTGEQITYFSLTGLNNQQTSLDNLTDGKPSLVFIFEQPCSMCNKSIVFWTKLATLSNGKVDVYAVILDDYQQAIGFSESRELPFKLFIPTDRNAFLNAFRVRSKFAQTVLVDGKTVVSVKFGNLDDRGFLSLIDNINELINKRGL